MKKVQLEGMSTIHVERLLRLGLEAIPMFSSH